MVWKHSWGVEGVARPTRGRRPRPGGVYKVTEGLLCYAGYEDTKRIEKNAVERTRC